MTKRYRLATVSFFADDEKELLVAHVDDDFYYLNNGTKKWVKDNHISYRIYHFPPSADPVTDIEAREIAEQWYPGRGWELVPGEPAEE